MKVESSVNSDFEKLEDTSYGEKSEHVHFEIEQIEKSMPAESPERTTKHIIDLEQGRSQDIHINSVDLPSLLEDVGTFSLRRYKHLAKKQN